HRRRRAPAAQLEAGGGERLERHAGAAELLGDVGPERSALAHGGDRLDGEAGVPIDRVRVRRGHLRRCPDAGEEGLIALHHDGHAASASSSSSAAAIPSTLSNTLRFSIRSGNSMSNASSSASITFTLACEVIPAWNRSASSRTLSMSTGSRAW